MFYFRTIIVPILILLASYYIASPKPRKLYEFIDLIFRLLPILFAYANRGFRYKIVFWDDMEKIRTNIKKELNRQLEQLETGGSQRFKQDGTPESL